MAYAFNDDKSKLRIDNTWTKIKNGLYCRKVLDNVQVWSNAVEVRYEKDQYGWYEGVLGILPSEFRPNNKIWSQIRVAFDFSNEVVDGAIQIDVDGTMTIETYKTGTSSAVVANFYRYFEFPCTVPPIGE